MSRLPTQRWEPSVVLDIITAGNDISCAGITLKGLPCRFDLGGEPKRQARHLLISMSRRSPRAALDDLPQLSQLCLCQNYHQKQAARVVAEWTALIEPHASNLERADTSGHGSTSSSGPKLSVDDIIAELNALSIRQDELRSLLADAQLSEAGSARTSPFPNIAHLANRTPLSELSELSERGESDSSRAGQGHRRGSPSSRDGWKRVFGRRKDSN